MHVDGAEGVAAWCSKRVCCFGSGSPKCSGERMPAPLFVLASHQGVQCSGQRCIAKSLLA